MLPKHIFREYDVRGLVEEDLTPEVVVGLGRGLGTLFGKAGARVVGVGRDMRASGERLRDNLVEGLLSTGCDVVDFGMVPTPALYHAIHTGPELAGIQITGSHNPPEFNGFKIQLGEASFFGSQIQELRDCIEHERYASGDGRRTERDALGPYLDDLVQRTKLSRAPRFAYDGGNGAAGLVTEQLFQRLGLDPIGLYVEPDGTFPNHHPDPTMPENLADLRQRVLDDGLELGIGYDGDADRIGVVDDRGDILWGDRLLMLYARQLLKEHPGSGVIFDVKCTQALTEDIRAHGGEPIIWKTGHSLIKQKLKETGARMAGEMSGHMFFADRYYGYDDAIYATLRLLEIVASDPRPLSEQLADVPAMKATPEIRVDCPDEIKFDVVARVTEHFRASHDIIDIDGVRVLFDGGWGLVRASNTQPALVVRVEAAQQGQVDDYLARLEDAIASARGALGGD